MRECRVSQEIEELMRQMEIEDDRNFRRGYDDLKKRKADDVPDFTVKPDNDANK